MSKYDVIVVGAGPAGIFACYELTRKAPHWKVLLLDKGHDIYRRRCPIRS
ncbi:MAG: NAD(P)-binding protein, partial [Paenibacillaceae bacterium]|nr:NAD(P)-binding protein [Paenibacillaceae bacterium]